MPSDIKIRFGSARGAPERYFRVQVSLDGGRCFSDALVLKQDGSGPSQEDPPYRVEWAASDALGRAAEAALRGLPNRHHARPTRTALEKGLKGMPRSCFSPDAQIPVDLDVAIADMRIERGRNAKKGPTPWEQEADATARRRAGIADQSGAEGDARMPELFRWVPWFEELAERVSEGGRKGLVERAKKVEWAGYNRAVLNHGEANADPLTFFYHLGSIGRGSPEKRKKVYASVAREFGIASDLDYSSNDCFVFPHGDPRNIGFYNKGDDPDLPWEMFDQACAVDRISYGAVNAATFDKMLQISGVGIPKFTQVLFLMNPKAFLPFDNAAVLPLGAGKWKSAPARMSWGEYVGEMDRIRAAFPGCQHYEINVVGYLWESGGLPREDRSWYQIGCSDNEWRDFRDGNWIRHGGSGEHRPAESQDPPAAKQGYALSDPEPGDVILVRTGTRGGRGIGIVYRNDYDKQSDGSGPIHVLWVNKARGDLAADMPEIPFSRVGRPAYEAFAGSDAYAATLKLLPAPALEETTDPDIPPQTHPTRKRPRVHHDLNTILYGPPGTGKTWHTVTRAVAIVEGREVSEVEQEERATVKRRFDEYRKADRDGRIEMVTFHQNTTYEDFVEGIRPVLAGQRGDIPQSSDSRRPESHAPSGPEHSRDIQYEMSRGVFRRMAERAEANPGARHVLVIDEINRGNIARIFGELITLIEDSKRIGEDDEARVTLPGSKTDFGVPANLHVLGTMNTADRSIALLDTALRRRFVFKEMMPNPSHPLIEADLDGIDCGRMLEAMNRRIAVLLDREHQIGHTYLLGVNTLPKLADTFRDRIMPLLQEYFYDDWKKIRAVLNDNGFVQKSDPPKELVNLGLADAEQSVFDLVRASNERWTDVTAYQKIYRRAGKANSDDGAPEPAR